MKKLMVFGLVALMSLVGASAFADEPEAPQGPSEDPPATTNTTPPAKEAKKEEKTTCKDDKKEDQKEEKKETKRPRRPIAIED